MVKCRNCGLIYRLPQVNKKKYMEDILKHYSQVDPFLKVAYSREKLYLRFLRQIQPIQVKNSRLLDIGCGVGYFLFLAKNNGWNVYGIESSPDLVKIGIRDYKLNIQCTDYEESNFPSSYFDVATIWNVFDELSDPLKCILKIKITLKRDGLLYMRTPNAVFHLFTYRIHQTLKKLHFGHVIPYQSSIFHIFNFSKKTLKWIFSHNGFKNIKVKNSWLTSKDPYEVKKGVRIFKIVVFLITQCIFILTLGKLTVAPSIEVFAENAKT